MVANLVKPAIELAVSLGVGAVVGNAVKHVTPDSLNIAQKVVMGVGSFVISGAVSDFACNYATDKFDKTAKSIKSIIDKNKPKEELVEAN